MSAFDWKPAWDSFEDDHVDFPGQEFYVLPNDKRIFPGDRFWDTGRHYIIEVTDVKTRYYTGEVGIAGEEGGDYIFLEADWTPPRAPHDATHYTDDIQYIAVEEFTAKLANDELVAHRGNGLVAPP